jgi:hypothetical protein
MARVSTDFNPCMACEPCSPWNNPDSHPAPDATPFQQQGSSERNWKTPTAGRNPRRERDGFLHPPCRSCRHRREDLHFSMSESQPLLHVLERASPQQTPDKKQA